MGFTDFPEFPHSTYYENDMGEFIRLYKELLNAYSGTLEQINAVSKRLDDYMNTMNSRVADAIASAMVPYRAEIANIKENIDGVNRRIGELKLYVDEHDESLRTTFIRLISQSEETLTQRIDIEVTTLQRNIDNAILALNKRIDDLSTKVDADKLELLDMIETQNIRIDHINEKTYADMIVRDTATLAKANDYTDLEIAQVVQRISDIEQSIDTTSLKWLWDNGCNFGGYDAMQWYMDSEVTAEEWQKRHFTCVDWYVRGREVFHWFDRRKFMFSPISGRRLPVQKIILEICGLLKNALTAEQYEALQITAKDYDDKDITAFQYDWNGKEILNGVHE